MNGNLVGFDVIHYSVWRGEIEIKPRFIDNFNARFVTREENVLGFEELGDHAVIVRVQERDTLYRLECLPEDVEFYFPLSKRGENTDKT